MYIYSTILPLKSLFVPILSKFYVNLMSILCQNTLTKSVLFVLKIATLEERDIPKCIAKIFHIRHIKGLPPSQLMFRIFNLGTD